MKEYGDYLEDMLRILRERIGEYDIKIVITVMKNSVVLGQISKLRNYEVAFEVCISKIQRLRDYWKKKGELEPFPETDLDFISPRKQGDK